MLSDNYKLIHYWETGVDELYDLSNDRAEEYDVGGDHPEVAEMMRDELLAWLEDAGANYAAPDPGFDAEQSAAVAAFRRDTLLPLMEKRRAQMFEEGWRPNAGWWGSGK
jgi:hypothetical protein